MQEQKTILQLGSWALATHTSNLLAQWDRQPICSHLSSTCSLMYQALVLRQTDRQWLKDTRQAAWARDGTHTTLRAVRRDLYPGLLILGGAPAR